MSGLTITESSIQGGWTSLAIKGEIDLATVDQLREAVDSVRENGSDNLVVDLRPAGFMDSTGLKTLVMAARDFEEAGRAFALAVAAGPLWRLIDLSGVATKMTIVEDPEDVVGVSADT